jgi:hypothetical protein
VTPLVDYTTEATFRKPLRPLGLRSESMSQNPTDCGDQAIYAHLLGMTKTRTGLTLESSFTP